LVERWSGGFLVASFCDAKSFTKSIEIHMGRYGELWGNMDKSICKMEFPMEKNGNFIQAISQIFLPPSDPSLK
jgi:hypothetical protein